jgi:hypothetical protein
MINILYLIVSFFLGLISSFVIDYIKTFFKRKSSKEFVITYLQKTIFTCIPEIINDANKLKAKLIDNTSDNIKLHAFEDFNTDVLNAITPKEYYDIFKKEYILFNNIYTMIKYISSNMPSDIHDNYINSVSLHLKESKNNISHLETCNYCIDLKQNTIKLIEFRINESIKLQKKIDELLKLCN